MKIEEKSFDSVEEYLIFIYGQDKSKIRLFRGQMEDWPLDSKLFRFVQEKNQINNFYKIEKQILNDFQKQYESAYETELNERESLSLGQHYGLPTRLIDWTKDPLIALWFAFEKEKDNEEDRVVFGLVVEKINIMDSQSVTLLGGSYIKIFKPEPLDERIINQKSWFSIQPPQIFRKGGDGLPHFNNYNILNEDEHFENYLIKFKFKNSLRLEILDKLDENGINSMKIFPGLTGLCKMIEMNVINNYHQNNLQSVRNS